MKKRGAGDVHVRPRALADELLEERRGVDRLRLAADGGVLHVGERGVDQAAVAPVHRPGPGVVAARLAGRDDLVAPVVVVPHDPGVEVAERAVHRAGQRCEVDKMGRAELRA